MSSISLSFLANTTSSSVFLSPHPPSSTFLNHSLCFQCRRYPTLSISLSLTSRKSVFVAKSSSSSSSSSSEEGASDGVSAGSVERESEEAEDEWLSKLPDKKKPLYSHSLPCIEAWLRNLGFSQSNEDRAAWFIEKPYWHAKLSLDITELYIRYLKKGPGNLEKDVERRFSYALCREDIENAVLGGP